MATNSDRFEIQTGQQTMKAVVTLGNGGFDQLDYRDVPIPTIDKGDVLVQVLAAGVNNTEINTRLGWYSETVDKATTEMNRDDDLKHAAKANADGGWNEATPFPFIQGTDCCGKVVAISDANHSELLNKRVLIRSCIRTEGWDSYENIWMASDFDGAFAQFVKIPASEVFPIQSDWTDIELGSIPCAYATAENMVHRCNVQESDHVLIPGGSGGVGSALIQLCKRRGARVSTIVGASKVDLIKALGADQVFDRSVDIEQVLSKDAPNVVIDNVAGENFGSLLKVMARGGRYASSGAIAGPIVSLDMRTMYLKDIKLIGCTAWDKEVFPNLISYIERNEIRPIIAGNHPLEQIVKAQKEFLEKKHVGKFVLTPPPLTEEQENYLSSLNS